MRSLSYNFWPVEVGAEVVGTDSSHKQKLAPSGTTVTLPSYEESIIHIVECILSSEDLHHL